MDVRKDAYGDETTNRASFAFELRSEKARVHPGKWVGADKPTLGHTIIRDRKTGSVEVVLRKTVEPKPRDVADVTIFVAARDAKDGPVTEEDRKRLYEQAVAALREKVPGAEVAVLDF